ncbi:hypothetical protein MSG28_013205 [Choristoneura fumiferana]|uniref:Uncharacterized protein n=1 Tax=Choristoneura fumiferana TaxID=7141 RepID=A0ACC0KSF9_CHOFU|nr:hypothetical protein MSG28_013205 [Choristoneura fumiferana]
MFESLVSRLTSPPVSRRRHTVHASREVCSEPEEEAAAPAQRRSRTAKQLLDKRRKARLSCADLTAATNAEPERSRMDALKAFLPLRQSKSLGRLDGLKEVHAENAARGLRRPSHARAPASRTCRCPSRPSPHNLTQSKTPYSSTNKIPHKFTS